jgi:hypothetical protein
LTSTTANEYGDPMVGISILPWNVPSPLPSKTLNALLASVFASLLDTRIDSSHVADPRREGTGSVVE